jgi:Zn finger protein HypA/HybF involved in hydrogenase expression
MMKHIMTEEHASFFQKLLKDFLESIREIDHQTYTYATDTVIERAAIMFLLANARAFYCTKCEQLFTSGPVRLDKTGHLTDEAMALSYDIIYHVYGDVVQGFDYKCPACNSRDNVVIYTFYRINQMIQELERNTLMTNSLVNTIDAQRKLLEPTIRLLREEGLHPNADDMITSTPEMLVANLQIVFAELRVLREENVRLKQGIRE